MVNVFFRGFGTWFYNFAGQGWESQVGFSYQASGVFRLSEADETAYRYTKRFPCVVNLLPSNHPDCEFSRMVRLNNLFCKELDFHISSDDAGDCFFLITQGRTETLVIVESQNEVKTQNKSEIGAKIPQIKNGELEAETHFHLSDDLITLNEAASVLWANADPAQRDTHPTNETVADWLKSKGFSAISAAQGAVIIRPKWAAKGRR